MKSRHAPGANPVRRQQARPRRTGFTRCAAAAVLLITASGCASPDATLRAPWKMEPVFKVNHTMQSSQAYYELGRYFDGSALWDKAIDAYRKAIAVDATHVEAYNALGVALAQSVRYADAELTLRQAVALAPDRSHILNNLGYVLLLAGKADDAVVALKTAVSRDGGNAGAAANLQLALARATRRGDSAIAEATPAAGSAPKPPSPTAHATTPEVDRPDARIAAAVRDVPVPHPSNGSSVPDASAPSLASSAKPAAVDEPAWRLEVSNGNGVPGMAGRLSRWLAAQGFATQRLTNQSSFDRQHTVVQYREGHEAAALRLARSMPAGVKVDTKPNPGLRSDVRVVLGRDWARLTACLDAGSCESGGPAVALVVP